MKVAGKDYRTVWMEGSSVKTINQPLLPHRFEIVALPTHRDTAAAIKNMTLRGAGAIGAAGGFGMAQVFLEAPANGPERSQYIAAGYEALRDTRPTARDLFYAIDRVRAAGEAAPQEPVGRRDGQPREEAGGPLHPDRPGQRGAEEIPERAVPEVGLAGEDRFGAVGGRARRRRHQHRPRDGPHIYGVRPVCLGAEGVY